MSKLYPVKLTSAIVLEGQIRRAGSVLWLSQNDAADLLRRNKARIADEAVEPGAEALDSELEVEPEPEPETEPEPELEVEPETEPKPAKSSRAKQERAQ